MMTRAAPLKTSAMLFACLAAIACSSGAHAPSLRDRMLALRQGLESGARDIRSLTGPAPLCEADLDLIEAAGIDTSRLVGRDTAALVEVLRFGASLAEDEWPAVAVFASSKDGRPLAWPVAILFVARGEIDVAARLAVDALADTPPDNRSYAMWKRWEWFYGERDDYISLTQSFTTALLRLGELGAGNDRAVIADLFGVPELSATVVAELRGQIDKSSQQRAAAREVELRTLRAEGPIWVEDRKGLRQVERTTSQDIERWEVRLGAASGNEPWGTLVASYDRNAQAKADALRALAEASGEDLAPFASGVGPIARLRRPRAARDPFSWPVTALDDSLTSTLAAGSFARTLAGLHACLSAEEREAATAHAHNAFALVRRAATRMRALTRSKRVEDDVDEAGDDRLTAQLDEATRAVAVWADETLGKRAAPAGGGSWRNMYFEGAKARTCRTVVQRANTTISFVEVSSRQGASDVPGTYRDARVQTVRREELQGASYDVVTSNPRDSAPATLTVTTARPVRIHWYGIPPRDSRAFQLTHSGGARVRGHESSINVRCDSLEHAQELATQLQAFASGKGR